MRICLEQSAFPGVIRVTEKVAHDVELVSGKKPQILVEKEIPETLESSGEDWTIIAATKGKSSFLKKLEEAGSAELKELEQKRECYAWIFPEIKNRTKKMFFMVNFFALFSAFVSAYQSILCCYIFNQPPG